LLKYEGLDLTGVWGFIIDCYNTLIDIYTEEDSIGTYIPISRWLIYQRSKLRKSLP
jgi:putative hydrolase of the HAD superfamily